ncbi:hypothetical protein J2X07_000528 [Fictibacillus barbaricus]|uniref:Uncharacterized protein n=1 Tax=Fictibacillus barbaricus TaxID=182136 RepID=A0ABU1TWG8_9BACL|nr:hypothetical protein [Fictibacillus barbaricus]
MESFGFIIGIVAFVFALDCKSKMKKLEERIKKLEKY